MKEVARFVIRRTPMPVLVSYVNIKFSWQYFATCNKTASSVHSFTSTKYDFMIFQIVSENEELRMGKKSLLDPIYYFAYYFQLSQLLML
jgi:hypothetical protein